jgi:four helix bundle protein
MKDFHKLEVWEKSHRLALVIYEATARFPKSEQYGLMGQMRRAAVSIPTNIAEGCGRGGDAEFRRFIRFAMGSATELEYELLLARGLGMLKPDEYTQLSENAVEIKRMLTSFCRKLKTDGR